MTLTSGIYKFAKKIVNRFYYAGVFDILSQPKNNLKNVNLVKGEKSYIDLSAVLITKGSGQIILKGKNVIGRQSELQPSNDGLIKIGYGTSIQDRNIIIGDVEFGRYCLTAPNVFISSGRHYYNHNPNFYIKDQDAMVFASQELASKHSKKVTIEDDVWIGINSVIMSGITIGRGAIIGSNSVVTSNVPPFSIVAGAPAKFIKNRLEFIPKSILKFDNDYDLPNFYKGFFVNMENLEQDRKSGGISTSSVFNAYMKDEGKRIQLNLKKIKNVSITLNYNNQEIEINNTDFHIISFELHNGNYHQFTINSAVLKDDEEKYLLVKEIVILN